MGSEIVGLTLASELNAKIYTTNVNYEKTDSPINDINEEKIISAVKIPGKILNNTNKNA